MRAQASLEFLVSLAALAGALVLVVQGASVFRPDANATADEMKAERLAALCNLAYLNGKGALVEKSVAVEGAKTEGNRIIVGRREATCYSGNISISGEMRVEGEKRWF